MADSSASISPHLQNIKAGGSADLKWSVTDCTDSYIMGIPGYPHGKPLTGDSGTETVSPEHSQNYMVTCHQCNVDKTWDTALVMVDPSDS